MEGIVELHDVRARWRAVLAPRHRFLLFAALLAALVAAFAYVVVHFQNDSRHQAEARFQDEVTLTEQFTSALLGTSASSSAATTAKTFGGKTIPAAKLRTSAGTAYLVILDAHGKRLGASPGAPADAAAPGAPHVREALAGKPWFSDLRIAAKPSADLLEWALPFPTPYGRRVLVEGVPAAAFASFLDSLLLKTQQSGKGGAFILDSHDRVIGSSSTKLHTGQRPNSSGLLAALHRGSEGSYHYSGADRYFAARPIDGTTWTAVMSTTTGTLYPSLVGSESWILDAGLVAFAIACAMSALFFRRVLISGSALQRSNEELAEVNASLEDRVAERTAAAEDRARELARSNQELEQFSSVASHDLQEPLRKVRMFGDRLRGRLGDDVSPEAIEDLRRMQNAAERMQGLISDLLEFSRITHRGQPFATVDLGEVAAEVVSDLEPRILELDATVDVGELPVVHADRTQMRQLLQNLISNALKFHRPDEKPVVRVRASVIPALAPRFAAETVASDRYVLTVDDNGIGFDEQYAERIFGAFERLHGRAVYEGTGIGLSIARKIVWRHGGHIAATAVPGEGATFTITLPLNPPTVPNGGSE